MAAVCPIVVGATEGGLIGYGIERADLFRRAVDHLDRVFKGATPAGTAGAAAEQIQTRGQCEDGYGARTDCSAVIARDRRSHRIAMYGPTFCSDVRLHAELINRAR